MAARAFLASLLLLVSVSTVSAATWTVPMDLQDKMSSSLQVRLVSAQPADVIEIIVQYDSFEDRDRLDALGLPVAYQLGSIPADFVYATPAQVMELAEKRGVLYLEHNDPIEYDMDTAVIAGNASALWAPATPTITVNGTKIDGKGITVAVVDTGVNAAHDDIKHRSKTVRNMMAVTAPEQPGDPMSGNVLRFEDMENSDGGGHGSHVAGIVAGDGKLSGGKFRGSAPGASLVGLGSLNANFWYAVAAWDWVFQNHNKVTPNIRIITNSWGYSAGIPCDPAISLTKIQKRLVLEAHVAMFFSAGNTGTAATGERDSTRTQFKCPWEGNIGVANYFDMNSGTRDGYMSNSTSKGKKDDVTTWPDISAPGTMIMATKGEPVTAAPAPTNPTPSYLIGCQLLRAATQQTTGCYTAKSGTSMATPFAAGVGALVLQARPDLKPADLEYILEQTAYKLNNMFDPNDLYSVDAGKDYRHHGSHYVRGHGLIDAAAAVQFALNYTGEMSPVVYGEKEMPSKTGLGRVKAVSAAKPDSVDTPGIGLFAALVAVSALLVVLRRRDA